MKDKILNTLTMEFELGRELLHHRLTRKEIDKIVSTVLGRDVEVLDQDLRSADAMSDFRFDIAITFNKDFDLFGNIYYLKTNQEDLLYITEVSNFEFQ